MAYETGNSFEQDRATFRDMEVQPTGLAAEDINRWKNQSEKTEIPEEIDRPRDIDQVRLSAAEWQKNLYPAGSPPPPGIFD